MEVCVYRIVQEAMTNVARHSGARSATVNLSQTDEGLRVTIEDDGRGIARRVQRSGATSTRGVGVIAMRERALALGGTFAMEQRRDRGTRVIVHLPAAAPPSDPADPSEKSREELLAG